MESAFDIGKLGWFTVQFVEPNDFLNKKLTDDKYGTWFTVKFMGDASTHLWMAKTAPQPGEKVYGHIEMTSSGKSTKFKRAPKDQIPAEQGAQPNSTPSSSAPASSVPHNTDQQESIARSVALKAAVDYVSSFNMSGPDTSIVTGVADEFLAWLQGSTPAKPVVEDVNPLGSGYEAFRQQGAKLADKRDSDDMQSLMQQGEPYQEEEVPPYWDR